jgi:hypothetical protein
MSTTDEGATMERTEYLLKCVEGCGEPWATEDREAALAKADLHELSSGHPVQIIQTRLPVTPVLTDDQKNKMRDRIQDALRDMW